MKKVMKLVQELDRWLELQRRHIEAGREQWVLKANEEMVDTVGELEQELGKVVPEDVPAAKRPMSYSEWMAENEHLLLSMYHYGMFAKAVEGYSAFCEEFYAAYLRIALKKLVK